METNVGKLMLPFKLQQLLDIIIDKQCFDIEDALDYLYSSELYCQLSSESSHLWQMSTLNLYERLITEKNEKRHQQNISPEALLFVAFCIENYKEHKRMDASEVLLMFKKHDVVDYLTEGYGVLHTQGKEYIMSNIDHYINNRR